MVCISIFDSLMNSNANHIPAKNSKLHQLNNWEEKYTTSHILDDFYSCGNFWMVMFITIQKNWGVVDITIQEFSLPSKETGKQQTLPSKNFHYHPKSYFDESKVLKKSRILNFQQECYYCKKLMGVLVFTKVRGLANFESPRTLRVLGLSNFTCPWTFAKTNTPINFLQ